eukprot:scaffold1467_cov264-Pinguiococcus_pyrenoidosus.AAC.14
MQPGGPRSGASSRGRVASPRSEYWDRRCTCPSASPCRAVQGSPVPFFWFHSPLSESSSQPLECFKLSLQQAKFVAHHADSIADAQVRHLLADFGDHPRRLVSQDHRRGDDEVPDAPALVVRHIRAWKAGEVSVFRENR